MGKTNRQFKLKIMKQLQEYGITFTVVHSEQNIGLLRGYSRFLKHPLPVLNLNRNDMSTYVVR